MLYGSIPDMGLKGFTKNQFKALPSRCCLQVHFTAFGIFLGEEILTEDQTEWETGSGGLGLAVEMLGEAALEVGGVAHVQVAVVHGEKDVDAVLQFRGHPHSRA